MSGRGMGREDRIRLRGDFQRIKSEGKRFRTRNFLVNYQVLPEGRIRLGTLTTRMKRAVDRNRSKRLVREFFRLNREGIKAVFQHGRAGTEFGLELVVVCYPGVETMTYEQASRELGAALEVETLNSGKNK